MKAVSTAPSAPAPALEREGEELDAMRVAKPRRAAPADAVRPTRAEINLGHLRHNLRVIERALDTTKAPGQKRADVWAVLKADAYGHGAPAVARTLERAGIAGFCVALLEEGIELREAGIRAPILVMGGYYGPHDRGLEEIDEHLLTPVVYHPNQIAKLATIARARQSPIGIHLKIDTGMSRLGVRPAMRESAAGAPSEADEMLELLARTREVRLDGLMSHLACADAADLAPTLEQLRVFGRVRERAGALGLSPRYVHIANSAAALRLSSSHFDAVRPGIAVYGVAPFDPKASGAADGEPSLAGELKPVMRVRTEVVALRTLADGERVGYGHTYEAKGTRVIATIPMGYADGLSRALSNKGHVLVRGKRAPIVGVVSMDLSAIDVTDIPNAKVGDEAVILGKQEGPLGADTITAEEIAEHVGTISWEILTHISRRVPRFYREP